MKRLTILPRNLAVLFFTLLLAASKIVLSLLVKSAIRAGK